MSTSTHSPNPVISIRGLNVSYNAKAVLQDVNVDIYPGQVTVILGGSGCGKTTLLKSILRLTDVQSGKITFMGDDVAAMTEDEFNAKLKRIGMLFQGGALINSISVRDNVSIPLEQHTKLSRSIIDRIIRVKLRLVRMEHALHLLPSELSGGMRKRAALARAIALDPEVLFCDEPSAGLDPLTSAALDELILDLKNQLKMTIIVVTHELASIHRIAERIIFLSEGKVLFQGTLPEARARRIPEIEQFFDSGKFD